MTRENTSGFSEAELAAMKERAAELRSEKGGKKKADGLQSLFDKIAEMPAGDKEVAVAVHQIVSEVAPDLEPRTWYGMPAYAKQGAVLIFLQPAAKFETRYSTLGFNDNAALDEGDLWPTSFAIGGITDAVREQIAELVRRAIG